MDLWIPAITIKAALTGFEELGIAKEVLLETVLLSEETLNDPYAAVPDLIFEQIFVQAFKLNPDPTLATKAALAIPYGEFGLLDHLVNTANTLGEGLHMLNLFLWLVATGITLEFEHSDGDWVWVLSDPKTDSDTISTQWTLALILNRMKSRIPSFSITNVHLSQPSKTPQDKATFEALWNTPVLLGAKKTGFKLGEGVWQLNNKNAAPDLKETLQTLAERIDIKQFTEAPLSYAVKARLPKALQEQAFAAKDIAQKLGLSTRTLQRKLAFEKMSFNELLDSYRQEKAINMLMNSECSMAEVAYALGYEEQSSFNRAFRRWMGVAPKTWLSNRNSG